MKNKIFFLALLLLISCNSNRLDKECEPAIDSFFNGIKEHKHMDALNQLLSLNKNINLNDSSVINLKNVFNNFNSTSGNYIGNKLLLKRAIDDDLIIYSYLVKYEKNFYRFIFIFYNPNGVPVLYRFMFDDKLEMELEESLSLYLNYKI